MNYQCPFGKKSDHVNSKYGRTLFGNQQSFILRDVGTHQQFPQVTVRIAILMLLERRCYPNKPSIVDEDDGSFELMNE